jgi:GTPase SAR1 family protein
MENAGGSAFAEPISTVVGGKVVEEIAKTAITQVTPSVVNYLKTWWVNHNIIVLGPARVGKTSFLDYLRHGILLQEQPTGRTLEPDRQSNFAIKLGRDGTLVLRVWSPIDIPGDYSAYEQINSIEEFRPNSIVIALDATSPLEGPVSISSIVWLEEFCQRLDILLQKDKELSNTLRTITVIMNKWDKFSDDSGTDTKHKQQFESSVKKIIDQYLKSSFSYYKGNKTIPIMRCSLVKSRFDTMLVDEIINKIALDLAK